MKRAVGTFLRQHLSWHTYSRLHSARRYWVSLATSFFTKRNPSVEGFPDSLASSIVCELSDINVIAPTKMCRIMNAYGSDKALERHNYTTLYSVLFRKYLDHPLPRIFELGLGTNNPALASTMGVRGTPGASLRGWRKLFPRALVYGADIDRDILFEDDRIQTFYCDQLDGLAIEELWSQPALKGGMDIIIEDGLHTFEANISFLDGSLQYLRPGGIYVIEDIETKVLARWRQELATSYSQRFPNHEVALVELPNEFNHLDNNLLIVRRLK